MANIKNEHVFPKGNGWISKREGNRKWSRSFENKIDAIEYTSTLALHDDGLVYPRV